MSTTVHEASWRGVESRERKAATPPGPRGTPLIGVLKPFSDNPLDFVTQTARRWEGGVIRLPFGPVTQYFITDPALIEEVLLTRSGSFIKDEMTRKLSTALGQGLLTTEGEAWKRSRKLVAPKLRKKQIEAYADAMVRHTEAAVGKWETGEVRDIHEEMMHLTLEIVAETLFGASVGDGAHKVGQCLESMMEVFVAEERTLLRFVPDWIPTPSRVKARKGIGDLDAVLFGMIEARRQGAPGDDLLWLLLTAEDDEGGRMSDLQLRDEAVTLFLAGHETTALALSFALTLIAEHSAFERRLTDEIDAVLGDRPATADDFMRLPLTTAAVKEAMRLYPPAWAIGREAIEEVEIGGYTIPKGGQVFMSQWVTHRDPRWFKDPERFDPERWMVEDPDRPRFAYFPFGGGPRVCVGNHFAMMEMVLVLATLYQRARVRRTSWEKLEISPAVTLRPTGPINMRIERIDKA